MKVYIVRAKRGIGVIYGVFDSRDRAAQYASTADVAIEEYEVSRKPRRTVNKNRKAFVPQIWLATKVSIRELLGRLT